MPHRYHTHVSKRLSLLYSCLLLIAANADGATDKYRLVLTDDPSTTATLAWNQISGAQPLVRYGDVDRGTDASAYAKTHYPDRVSDYRGMRSHFVRLRGLRPNTRYYFVIVDSEGVSQRLWFRTAPADRSRLSLIAGGDSRNNRDVRRKANRLVAKLKPHAVLFGGDMIDADNDAEWREWLDDWQLTTTTDGRLIPIVPTRGNHEAPGTIARLFDLPHEREYYALTFGNGMARVYTLNTEISVAGDQRDWLAADLAAHRGARWRMAQFHRPMRPHHSYKSEGTAHYTAWAKLFEDERVRLAIDCDSHVSKTTFPIRPTYETGSSEGFIRDDSRGTVYTGEGCWGAPLKGADDAKPWTRTMGSFNEFKLLFISETEIEHRTIRVDNADQVGEVSHDNPFLLPSGLDVYTTNGQGLIVISPFGELTPGPGVNPGSGGTSCAAAGTPCDDGRADTQADEQRGDCSCVGIPTSASRLQTRIASATDDAEEDVASGRVNLWSSDLELIDDWGRQTVGLRFANLVLPKGARVYRAYVQFCTDAPSAEATTLSLRGERQVPSAAFQGTSANLSARAMTQAAVAWSNVPPWAQAGECALPQRSPDVAAIIQEITSQANWRPGEALHLYLSGTGRRIAKAAESGSGAELIVYFEAGSACPPAQQPCDDGNASTRNDVTDGNCGCRGVLACPTAGQPCDDGNASTRDDLTDGNCGCRGVASCPAAGQACDDGNASTRNDVTDGNCGCRGVPSCPSAGQPCDDGNANTVQDITDGSCGCRGVPAIPPTTTPVTLSVRVQQGSDDAEERVDNGFMYLVSSDLELCEDPGSSIPEQLIGLRFASVAVPPGARISEAYLQFVADETHDRGTSLELSAERTGHSAVFTTQAFNLSRRTRTAGKVAWPKINPWAVGQRGIAQRSPDLSALVGEIVALGDWRSGQAMTFLIRGLGQRVAVSVEGRAADAATLVITYTTSLTSGGSTTGLASGVTGDARIDRAAFDASLGAARVSGSSQTPGMRLYPNPARDRVQLAMPAGLSLCNVEVYALSGARQDGVWSGDDALDLSSLAPGLYLVLVEGSDGRRIWHQVVKE